MTHGTELDEVNGDERNLSSTILDDAELEAVSGGTSMTVALLKMGYEGLYQASRAAHHR